LQSFAFKNKKLRTKIKNENEKTAGMKIMPENKKTKD
jgi:hypothetical protein